MTLGPKVKFAEPLASVLLICKNVESNKDHRKLKNCY